LVVVLPRFLEEKKALFENAIQKNFAPKTAPKNKRTKPDEQTNGLEFDSMIETSSATSLELEH
jgi:hypothetical protein